MSNKPSLTSKIRALATKSVATVKALATKSVATVKALATKSVATARKVSKYLATKFFVLFNFICLFTLVIWNYVLDEASDVTTTCKVKVVKCIKMLRNIDFTPKSHNVAKQ